MSNSKIFAWSLKILLTSKIIEHILDIDNDHQGVLHFPEVLLLLDVDDTYQQGVLHVPEVLLLLDVVDNIY